MTLGLVFTALGYATGALVLFLAARARGLNTSGMARIALVAGLGGVIGAKLTEWLVEGWPSRVPAWRILDPSLGGRALLGGVIVGWVCAEVAKRRMGINRSTGDLFALALPAGEAVGRIGCYFNQCCYGCPTDSPIAVYQHGAWRHPAQLYSSLVALLVFLVVIAMRTKMPREGDLFKLYLLLFGITRFGLEFLRERDQLLWGLSPMQWLCLDLAVVGSIGLTDSARKSPLLPAGANTLGGNPH